MESLNVKNINDEKIFNVIDPNGQGEVVNRIRPISISINQKAQTINDQTDSTINLAVYWNDTWKSILDLTFDESLRQEYGKLTQDLTNIQKDIDMKQYKDAETKTADFLKYVANLSSKYTAIPEKEVVSKIKNDFVKIKADKNSVKVAISDKLLNFMLKKYAKVDNLDYTKSDECYSTNKFNCLVNHYDIYYHSPEIFQKQAYMTVVKDNKVVGSYKVNYDQFSKFASKFMLTPQKLGYSKDRLAGYMKTAEVVMQNIFFDSVDEAKEWQEMVDEKKKEQATTPEGEEETTETTTTETKTEMGEGKSETPVKEDGGLARPSEDFASDEIPESEPRQQEQQGGGQNLGASKRINLLKKKAGNNDAELAEQKAMDLNYNWTEISQDIIDTIATSPLQSFMALYNSCSRNLKNDTDKIQIPKKIWDAAQKSNKFWKFKKPYNQIEIIATNKKARVGYNAEPENELEEKAVKIGDEIMNVEWDFGEEIQNLEDILEENPKNKRKIEKMILELKGKRIDAIKKVVEKYNKEFANKEIADLVYEHLQDHNAHKANSIVLNIVNGKQANKKVKLNKKARTVDSKQDIKQILKDKNAVEARNYGDFVSAIRENKTPIETIKAYGKKKTAGGYDEYVLVVYEGGAYFYTELSNGKRVDEKYYKFENVEKQAENRKNYNVVIGFDGKEEESDFAQEDVISALQEALIYFGEKWHELPSSLDNIDKLDFVKIREIEKGETVKEYTKEDILKMKEDFPKYSCNKKALYGDVQEQDIVPAKTETKVYLQSEDKGNKKQLPIFSVTVRRNSDDEVVDIIECNNQKEAEETYKYMLSDLDKDCYVSINKLVGKEEYTEIKNSSLNKEESCKNANKNKAISKQAEEYSPIDIVIASLYGLETSTVLTILRNYIDEDYFNFDEDELSENLDNFEDIYDYLVENYPTSEDLFDRNILDLEGHLDENAAESIIEDIKEKGLVVVNSSKKAKVQKQAEEQTIEEKIEEAETSDIVKGKIGVGDIVTVCIDKLEYPEEAFKYTELIGEPLILMENDKEDINKVIVEQTEYPFQRMTVNKDDICQYAEIKGVDVIVEDTDGDEMITTFEELPVVAKQCKIKSIHKAANISKKKANLTKKAINSLEDVAGLIDDILSDYDWYDYADQLEVGEKSHYENILADLQKDEKGTIEALFNRVSEDDEEYSSPKIEQLKEYYNNKFFNGGK